MAGTKEKELKAKLKAAKEAKKAADKALKKAEKLAEEVAKLESDINAEAKKAEESSSSDSDSSSSSSSDSDSDDDAKKATAAVKKEDSDSDSDSDDEEEKAKAAPAKAAVKKEDSSSDSSDSSDSDSSDNEDDKKTNKMDVEKKSSDSDSSSSDSDSDSDSDSTPASVPPVDDSASKKRKADEEAVEPALKKQAVGGDDEGTKLYIRGLPWRATEEGVRDFFKACGSGPKSVELPLQEDGRSSGTAILDFHDAASAAAAMELNGADFEGRWLSIKYSTPKPILGAREVSQKQEGCCTVFVGNLSWDIDEETLRAAFADCGTVTQVRFSTDRETGDFKGYGHIEFAETEATDAAVKIAGTDICGRPVRVDFANDKRQSFGGGGGGRGGFGGGRGGGSRFGSGDRGRGGGRGGFGSGDRGGGRGGFGSGDRGRGGGRGGGSSLHKKSGGIADFAGKKITFD
mmetsp:Transcript_10713/g.22257  ORF Transcript_10713/g.22257 Transcript_10713/m.22257 type:complete len:459 (-) Transcript_10713:1132-2508(-)